MKYIAYATVAAGLLLLLAFYIYNSADTELIRAEYNAAIVTVYRKHDFWDADTAYYRVKYDGKSASGPFYIGPIFSNTPSFASHIIGGNILIVDRMEQDRVYIVVECDRQTSYPSTSSTRTDRERVDDFIVSSYRRSAALYGLAGH